MANNRNTFSLGAQIGGPKAADATRQQEQELRNAINRWSGDYTRAIREFAFLLHVDGEIHTYTQLWGSVGARAAKRKRDWVEVEIGVPEAWWREDHGKKYKVYLTAEIEKGLRSMIDLLQRNQHAVDAEALLTDWESIKRGYLESSNPATPARD